MKRTKNIKIAILLYAIYILVYSQRGFFFCIWITYFLSFLQKWDRTANIVPFLLPIIFSCKCTIARKLFTVSFRNRIWDLLTLVHGVIFENISTSTSDIISPQECIMFLVHIFVLFISPLHCHCMCLFFMVWLLVFLKSWLPFIMILLRVSQRLPQHVWGNVSS